MALPNVLPSATVLDQRYGAGSPYIVGSDDHANVLLTSYVHTVSGFKIVGPPDTTWEEWTYVLPGDKGERVVVWYFSQTAKWHAYDGQMHLTAPSPARSKEYVVKQLSTGALADMEKLRRGDVSGQWSAQPSVMADLIEKQPGQEIGKIFADAVANPASVLNAHGDKWLSPDEDIPHNFNDPDMGFYKNLTYDQELTQDNVLAAVERMILRRGTDGRYLKLLPKFLLVPQKYATRADLLMNVLRVVPDRGPGGADTGGNTSKVASMLIPLVSHELPEHLWGVMPDRSAIQDVKHLPFISPRGIAGWQGETVGNFNTVDMAMKYADFTGQGTPPPAAPGVGVPVIEVRYYGPGSAFFETSGRKIAVDITSTRAWYPQDARYLEICSTEVAP